MAPSKISASWDESDSEADSTPQSSPPAVPVRRGKFEDEEDEDVLEDWENEPDSEEEREKAKQAEAAKAKAEAEAKASHKSKSQRRAERIEENMRKKQHVLDMDSSDDEDEAAKRARLRAAEKESDLRNAEDLFGGAGSGKADRGIKPITVVDEKDPGNAIDLSSMKLFNPATPQQFLKLRETLVPLLTANSKKPSYATFMPELAKQLCKEMSSEQIKKVASALTTLSNEKMREEKAAEKGGKKTKAAKTKTTLNASRYMEVANDTADYSYGLDDDDFM
ncbi:translation initiation factor eIF3 subunit [Piedraia hortae CBS 480.64]|uniref:Eukaryotic translation initiation factor 3 subunit J n=1 Tax=Piedraia hortae CBS 480.64 TaxID=1314780 RepID=A0A6A7BRE1_9PEZI|nr:translation initiation factor eIF3 subunit [Piedraia hortae CBS 480.64]